MIGETILIWLLLVSVNAHYQHRDVPSPVIYYTEDSCELEVEKISNIARKHITVRCKIDCKGKNAECQKAIFNYQQRKAKDNQ